MAEIQVITMPAHAAARMTGKFDEPNSRLLLHVALENLKGAMAGLLTQQARMLEQLEARRQQGDVKALVAEYEKAHAQELSEFLQALTRRG